MGGPRAAGHQASHFKQGNITRQAASDRVTTGPAQTERDEKPHMKAKVSLCLKLYGLQQRIAAEVLLFHCSPLWEP